MIKLYSHTFIYLISNIFNLRVKIIQKFFLSQQITDYHRIIKKPIALDIIRNKLKHDHINHYTDLRQVMADIRLMFKNAFTYNPVSQPAISSSSSCWIFSLSSSCFTSPPVSSISYFHRVLICLVLFRLIRKYIRRLEI